MPSPAYRVPIIEKALADQVAADLKSDRSTSDALKQNEERYKGINPELWTNLGLVVGTDNPEKVTELLGLLTAARNSSSEYHADLTVALSPYTSGGSGSGLHATVCREMLDLSHEPLTPPSQHFG